MKGPENSLKVNIKFIDTVNNGNHKLMIKLIFGGLEIYRNPSYVSYGDHILQIHEGVEIIKHRYSDIEIIIVEGNTSKDEKKMIYDALTKSA